MSTWSFTLHREPPEANIGEGALPSLLNITLDEIVSGLDAHHFTSVDLTNACIARVKEVDDVFRAVLEINKDAIPIAQALDEELKRTGRRRLVCIIRPRDV